MGGDQIVCGLKAAARAFPDGAITDGGFDAPRRAGAIRRPVGIERQVAQVTGPADMTAEQPAIDQRRPADTGAQREQDDVLKTARRANPSFAEQGRMPVVQHRNRF